MKQSYFKFKEFSALIIVIFIFGCASPKITNLSRGKYIYEKYSPNTILDVNVSLLPTSIFSASLPPIAQVPYFASLRDSLPHVFLRVIGAKADSIQQILDALKVPLFPEPIITGTYVPQDNNHQQFTIRWLFSSIKKYYNDPACLHPNTRLEFLNATLSLSDTSNIEIFSIDRIENEAEQVDLGTLQRTSESTFQSGITGNLGGYGLNTREYAQGLVGEESNGQQGGSNVYNEGGQLIGHLDQNGNLKSTNTTNNASKSEVRLGADVTANASVNMKNTMNEAMNLKFKRLKTGFSFGPHQLTVSQRGAPMMEIYDNVIVTTTLKAHDSITRRKASFAFSDMYRDPYNLLPVDSVDVARKYYNYVPCDLVSNLTPELHFEGALRMVKNNKRGRNILEYDDDITYRVFSDTTQDIEISKFSFCENVYELKIKLSGQNIEYPIRIETSQFNERLLMHQSDNPWSFIVWLYSIFKLPDPKLMTSKKFKLYFVDESDSKHFIIDNAGISIDDFKLLKEAEILMYTEKD